MRYFAPVFLALALAAPAEAFEIRAVLTNPDAWSPTQVDRIHQAIADWAPVTAHTAIDQQMTVAFHKVHASTAYLGQWQFGGNIPAEFCYSPGLVHTIYINADIVTWDDAAAPSPATYDLLTILRHELGHALGFTDSLYRDGATDRWATHISGNIFDPGGQDVPMRADAAHVDIGGDLMYYQLPRGVRKEVSDLDAQMLALAYGYILVPEPASLGILGAGAIFFLTQRKRQGNPRHF